MTDKTEIFAARKLYAVTGAGLFLAGLGLFLAYGFVMATGELLLPTLGHTAHYFIATGGAGIAAWGVALFLSRRHVAAAKTLAGATAFGFGLFALMRLAAAVGSPEMAASAGALLYVETVLFALLMAVFACARLNIKGAFIKNFMALNSGILSGPWYVLIWVSLLMLSNAVAPMGFLLAEALNPGSTGAFGPAAAVMTTAFLVGPFIGAIIYPYTGMSRLMGLMHAPWLIAVFVLYGAVSSPSGFMSPVTWFDTWLYAALATGIASLVIDALDVARYLIGQRRPVWKSAAFSEAGA